MQRQQTATLVQIGVALAVAGLAVKLALAVGLVLSPFANLALGIGIVMAIVGLVMPGRR